MLKITLLMLLFAGVIFGGRNIIKRLVHKWRMKRNDKFKRKADELYKQRFRSALKDIDHWRKETEPPHEKHINVVCKNPAMAQAWK